MAVLFFFLFPETAGIQFLKQSRYEYWVFVQELWYNGLLPNIENDSSCFFLLFTEAAAMQFLKPDVPTVVSGAEYPSRLRSGILDGVRFAFSAYL